MQFIGLDVHRDFCAIAISERGRVRYAGKVKTTPKQLEVLAQSLRPDDQVAMEATSNALAIARILEPQVARVVVATRRDLEAIARAKTKTDRLDATMLARLLAAGLLEGSLASGRHHQGPASASAAPRAARSLTHARQ